MTTGADVTATFCATLVDQWVRCGVTDAVVCPGSRSTPLALAVAADGRVTVHVHHDERSGGFVALGIGLATARPAVVVTTSGTAAVELHPAVVEAHEAGVPLVVATADRPPELQGVGAPQTIDQTDLYGRSVRWFVEPGVPDDDGAGGWRAMAARSVRAAIGPEPGPVHLNLAFREPLVGTAGDLPPVGEPDLEPVGPPPQGLADLLADLAPGSRGVLVAGGGVVRPEPILELARQLGWPVLADPRSGARVPGPNTIAYADAFLRHQPTAGRLQPELVVRLGQQPASKVVNQWLDAAPARQLLVHRSGRLIDPGHVVEQVITGEPGAACGVLADRLADRWPKPEGWLSDWAAAEATARAALAAGLQRHAEPTEPGVARAFAALTRRHPLVVSSSMPVRDVEWFAEPRRGLRVLANRGANGIDGVTSTAVGVALGARDRTALLIGDVAFLHDTNGLLGLAHRPIDLTIVVVDNDGGGIFSFLPQRRSLPEVRFEHLFGTPHGVDLAGLARAHGLPVSEVASMRELKLAFASAMAGEGVHVLVVRTDRAANVRVHEELMAEVAAALDRSA